MPNDARSHLLNTVDTGVYLSDRWQQRWQQQLQVLHWTLQRWCWCLSGSDHGKRLTANIKHTSPSKRSVQSSFSKHVVQCSGSICTTGGWTNGPFAMRAVADAQTACNRSKQWTQPLRCFYNCVFGMQGTQDLLRAKATFDTIAL